MLNHPSSYINIDNWLHPDECKQIINYGINFGRFNKPSTGYAAPGPSKINPKTRNGKLYFFSHEDVNKKILSKIQEVNKEFWNLDLYNIEPLQLSIYDVDDHYSWHRDQEFAGKHNPRHRDKDLVRKLSFSINLTEYMRDYEGGDLEINNGNPAGPAVVGPLRKQGNGTIFLSPTMHRVLPVTRGRRVSLVGWVSGPPYR